MNLEKIAENNRAIIKKLRSLPEEKKKAILWIVVTIAAIIMGTFWIKSTIDNFSKISGDIKNIKMPEISTPAMPSLDILQTTTPSNIK